MRDLGSYVSKRAEATSISHSLYGIRAVANFGNGTTVDTFNFLPNFLANSMPSPSTIISISTECFSGSNNKSLTQPPTRNAGTFVSSDKSLINLDIRYNRLFSLSVSLIKVIL